MSKAYVCDKYGWVYLELYYEDGKRLIDKELKQK